MSDYDTVETIAEAVRKSLKGYMYNIAIFDDGNGLRIGSDIAEAMPNASFSIRVQDMDEDDYDEDYTIEDYVQECIDNYESTKEVSH